MASTYQDVLVDALRDALGRDRPPPPPATIPDDVKSVAVQTLADENENDNRNEAERLKPFFTAVHKIRF